MIAILVPKESDHITFDYIEQLVASRPEQLITLWTVQHSSAVEAWQADKLVGQPKYAFSTANDKPGKKAAYLWMNAQMRKRGLTISDNDVPLWAFLSLPSGGGWESHFNDQLVHIAIPKQRVLISFHDAWQRFLNVACNPASEYLCANADDKSFLKARNFQKPDDETCRNSWEKMFDLSLAETAEFLWPLTLQATIAAFYASDIVDQAADFP